MPMSPRCRVASPQITRRRGSIEEKIADLIADLPNRFPPADKTNSDDRRTVEERRQANLERRFREWAGRQAAETVRWTILKPTRGYRESASAERASRRFDLRERRPEQARSLHAAILTR